MLHKIRLRAAGTPRVDFHANLGSGFDGRCCRFLGVEYPALRDRVLAGGTDDEVLAWCFAHGKRANEEQELVWNKFMIKRGWRDEDDGSTQNWSATRLRAAWPTGQTSSTFFDYYEVDEGRKT